MSETYTTTPISTDMPATDQTTEAVDTPSDESDVLSQIPSSAKAFAETVIAQNHDAYKRARESVDDSVSMMEVTAERAGEGAIALNRKVIDIAQDNLNASFDLAKQLAGAETLNGFMELQLAFVRTQFALLDTQASEMRELATEIADNTAAPYRAHLKHAIRMFKPAR